MIPLLIFVLLVVGSTDLWWPSVRHWRGKRQRAARLWLYAMLDRRRLLNERDGPKGPACRSCNTYLSATHEYGGHRFSCPELGMGGPLRNPGRWIDREKARLRAEGRL